MSATEESHAPEKEVPVVEEVTMVSIEPQPSSQETTMSPPTTESETSDQAISIDDDEVVADDTSDEEVVEEGLREGSKPYLVDWLPLPIGIPGKLCLSVIPGRQKPPDWDLNFEENLTFLRDSGVTTVVSLVRELELVGMRLGTVPEFQERIQAFAMTWLHFPIKDKWLPESTGGYKQLLLEIAERLCAGESILVHCNGGKGRAGTLATALLLILTKCGLQDAIIRVRTTRPGSIYNPAQIMYLRWHLTSIYALNWEVGAKYSYKKQPKLNTGKRKEGEVVSFSDEEEEEVDIAMMRAKAMSDPLLRSVLAESEDMEVEIARAEEREKREDRRKAEANGKLGKVMTKQGAAKAEATGRPGASLHHPHMISASTPVLPLVEREVKLAQAVIASGDGVGGSPPPKAGTGDSSAPAATPVP